MNFIGVAMNIIVTTKSHQPLMQTWNWVTGQWPLGWIRIDLVSSAFLSY